MDLRYMLEEGLTGLVSGLSMGGKTRVLVMGWMVVPYIKMGKYRKGIGLGDKSQEFYFEDIYFLYKWH